jgi:hypothetical protein
VSELQPDIENTMSNTKIVQKVIFLIADPEGVKVPPLFFRIPGFEQGMVFENVCFGVKIFISS